jgi:signal transduction histidine kinase
MKLSETIRDELLDPLSWQEELERFARATHLAVLLTDTQGRALGDCFNPQPTWSMLRHEKPLTSGECPFCIQAFQNGYNCIKRALETRTTVTTSDSAGLVHMAVPLFLFEQPLGALVAGQVFDHYANHLQLHKLAEKLHLSSDRVWLSARTEFPIRKETLQIYGKLLESLGNAFIHARYQAITDGEHLNEILEQTREELRGVTGRLVSAQEDERERLARDLHDGIGQSVVLLQFDLHALQQALPNDVRQPLLAQFEALTERITQIANAVRELSHELHPSVLMDLGLEEAVRQLADRLERQYFLSVHFSARDVQAEIEPSISLGLYRIIQEALQNIVKHAAATTVEIALAENRDCFEVMIKDDGKGFEPGEKNGGLGLINMAQRAELLGGRLTVESREGQGTKIKARVPLLPRSA